MSEVLQMRQPRLYQNIRENWLKLTAVIRVQDGLYGHLFQRGFFTTDEWERIESHKFRRKEVEELLKLIDSSTKYRLFCECLRANGQIPICKSVLEGVLSTIADDQNEKIANGFQNGYTRHNPYNHHTTCPSVMANLWQKIVIFFFYLWSVPFSLFFSKQVSEGGDMDRPPRHTRQDVVFEKPPIHRRHDVLRIIIYMKYCNGVNHHVIKWNVVSETLMGTVGDEDVVVNPVLNETETIFSNLIVKNTIQTQISTSSVALYVKAPDINSLEQIKHNYDQGSFGRTLNEIISKYQSTENILKGSLQLELPDIDYYRCWKKLAQPLICKNTDLQIDINSFHQNEHVSLLVRNDTENLIDIKLTLHDLVQMVDDNRDEVQEELYRKLTSKLKHCVGAGSPSTFISSIGSKGRSIEDIVEGSIVLRIRIPSRDSLDHLKCLIDTQNIQDMFAVKFLNKKWLMSFGVQSTKVRITMNQLQYLKIWRNLFLEEVLSGHTSVYLTKGKYVHAILNHNAEKKPGLESLAGQISLYIQRSLRPLSEAEDGESVASEGSCIYDIAMQDSQNVENPKSPDALQKLMLHIPKAPLTMNMGSPKSEEEYLQSLYGDVDKMGKRVKCLNMLLEKQDLDIKWQMLELEEKKKEIERNIDKSKASSEGIHNFNNRGLTKPRDQSRANQTRGDGSRSDQTRGDGSRTHHTRGDRSRAHQTRGDRSRAHQTRGDRSRTNQTRGDRSRTNQTRGDRSRANQTRGDRSRANQTRGDGSRSDQTRGDRSRANQTRGDGSRANQSRGDRSRANQTRGDRSRANQTRGDGSRSDQTRGDGSRANQTRGDGSRANHIKGR